MARTARRATCAIWRIFAELNNPKRALSKMNLTSIEVSMFMLPQNSENKPRGLYFSKALFDRLISGGAYIRREICVSKSARLILEGNLRLKIDWASL